MNDTMKEFIIKHLQNGGTVEIVLSEEGILRYAFSGFCKSGTVDLYEDDDTIFAEDRYGKDDPIYSWDDLVNLAFEWYKRSDSSTFYLPNEWKQEFLDRGLIEEIIVYKPVEQEFQYAYPHLNNSSRWG